MRVRGRPDRLRQALSGLPPPGQFDLVVAVPVGCGMADDLPPGVHLTTDGRVATVVFKGRGRTWLCWSRFRSGWHRRGRSSPHTPEPDRLSPRVSRSV
jgi:hypothetical protein